MVRRKASILAAIAALAVVTGVLHFADAEPVVVFAVAAAALGGLAWAISIATESVGERFGPAVTGALQSTLGNLPELFIVLFALSAGELVVARTSILGSLFANGLLVLGLAIVAGSRAASDGTMRFRPRLPQDTATLLLLAIGIIVLLGLSHQVGDRASGHETAISVVGAIVLLAVYGLWAWNYLRSDTPAEEAHAEPARVGAAVRACARGARSRGRRRGARLGLVHRRARSGGRGPRHLEGVHGPRDRRDRGERGRERRRGQPCGEGQVGPLISVVKNSVAQIAAFLFPALVLFSLAFTTHLTFVLSPVFIGALVVTALAMWQITGDGEALLFEGAALVGLYVILATLMWFE